MNVAVVDVVRGPEVIVVAGVHDVLEPLSSVEPWLPASWQQTGSIRCWWCSNPPVERRGWSHWHWSWRRPLGAQPRFKGGCRQVHEGAAGVVLCLEETTASLVHHIVCIIAARLRMFDGPVVRRHLEDVKVQRRRSIRYQLPFCLIPLRGRGRSTGSRLWA